MESDDPYLVLFVVLKYNIYCIVQLYFAIEYDNRFLHQS